MFLNSDGSSRSEPNELNANSFICPHEIKQFAQLFQKFVNFGGCDDIHSMVTELRDLIRLGYLILILKNRRTRVSSSINKETIFFAKALRFRSDEMTRV